MRHKGEQRCSDTQAQFLAFVLHLHTYQLPLAGDHLIGAGAMVKPLTEDKDASIAKSIALSQGVCS